MSYTGSRWSPQKRFIFAVFSGCGSAAVIVIRLRALNTSPSFLGRPATECLMGTEHVILNVEDAEPPL